MHKANLKEILEKIKEQRIDSQDSQNGHLRPPGRAEHEVCHEGSQKGLHYQ